MPYNLSFAVDAQSTSSPLHISIPSADNMQSLFDSIQVHSPKADTIVEAIHSVHGAFSTMDANTTIIDIVQRIPATIDFGTMGTLGKATVRLRFTEKHQMPLLLNLVTPMPDEVDPRMRAGRFFKGAARANGYGVVFKVDELRDAGKILHVWVLGSVYDAKYGALKQKRNTEFLREVGSKRSVYTGDTTLTQRQKAMRLSPEM